MMNDMMTEMGIMNMTAMDSSVTEEVPFTEEEYQSNSNSLVWWLIVSFVKWLWSLRTLLPQWAVAIVIICIAIRLLPLVWRVLQSLCPSPFCIDYCQRLHDTKRTQRELLRHFTKLKVGVWRDPQDSDDEWPYTPLPQEEELMREVELRLKSITTV